MGYDILHTHYEVILFLFGHRIRTIIRCMYLSFCLLA